MDKIKLTQIKSVIDRPKRQKLTIKALGIKKMHHTVLHNDTPAIRGMVDAVAHLLKVEKA